MCGIAGIYGPDAVPKQFVEKMLRAIDYRGPDHLQVNSYRDVRDQYLTVGQVRLSIMDPRPEANQPFESADGSSSLTFNGEFYNFLDLRPGLENQHALRTRSDTEVALHLMDQQPMESALNQLNGMFAGCYHRSSDGTFVLFRDRLGKKPLYYYQHNGLLYFASEPKAILAALDHVPELNRTALSYFFYLSYVPDFTCIYKGMYRLPPGALMTLNKHGEPQIESWYRVDQDAPNSEDQLEDCFFDAVRQRMIADVPLAAFLSGGLDSSLVVAAMSQLSSKRMSTFSVRFAGPQAFDESPFARMVAKHCYTDHNEIVLDHTKLRDMIPQVLDHFDEPFGDSSAIPMYLVSLEARRQFTVALSGDGADEVFAGYRKYLGEHYLAKLGPYALRRVFWNPICQMLPTGRTHKLLETNRRMRRLLTGDAATAAERHVRWLKMSPIDEQPLLGPELQQHNFDAVRAHLLSMLPSDAGLNDCLRFDQALVLGGQMFVKVDRMSMKASLEVRCPMVDYRMVQLANSLPAQTKLDGTLRKAVLLRRLGHLLPQEVLDRPKAGFEMPLGAWLRTDLREWAAHTLFETPAPAGLVNQNMLKKIWQTHQQGRLDCTETLWCHLVFNSWFQRTYA